MADTRKFLQVQSTTLAGSGISATATTIVLSSLVHLAAVGGGTVAMTDIGTLGWATLEPATSREEIISFTGISQNGDGTATITGVTRNLKSYSPYDQYSATGYAHAGGAAFIITNNPQMYDSMANKANDETITGLWDFSTSIPTLPASNPTTGNQATRKTYVDGLDALAVHLAGTETITGVKTFTSTAKAKYDVHPTFSADEEIIDKKYADDLAIAGAPDASTTVKGIVEEATQAEIIAGTGAGATGARLFVNPTQVAETGTDKIVKTKSTGLIDTAIIPVTVDSQVFTANGTWTKPSSITFVKVIAIAGGGGGARTSNGSTTTSGGGGAGGGLVEEVFLASILGATETVTVGTGGLGATTEATSGGAGNDSVFGAWLIAKGGGGGVDSTTSGNGGNGMGPGSAGGAANTVGTVAGLGGAGGTGGRSSAGAGVTGAIGSRFGAAAGASGGAGNANGGGVGGAQTYRGTTLTGGTAGTSAGGAGGSATNATTNELTPGAGGGGGGGATVTGGAGGNGGKYGGGGGGGGSGGTTSGNGGNGGDGIVVVISW